MCHRSSLGLDTFWRIWNLKCWNHRVLVQDGMQPALISTRVSFMALCLRKTMLTLFHVFWQYSAVHISIFPENVAYSLDCASISRNVEGLHNTVFTTLIGHNSCQIQYYTWLTISIPSLVIRTIYWSWLALSLVAWENRLLLSSATVL